MEVRDSRRVGIFAIGMAAFAFGCSGATAVSPTAPARTSPTSPDPSTGPPVVTMHGRVTETVPTTATGVSGALVSVDDDTGTTKSATADSFGYYSVGGLVPGALRIAITAQGYTPASVDLKGVGDAPVNFNIAPMPETITHTVTGTLSEQVGTCSDGTANKPCNIAVIAIHNPGALAAELTWTPAVNGNVAMTLFQTGVGTPLERSTAAGAAGQHLSATLPGGADYEVRITYEGGTGAVSYVVKISHQS